VGSPSPTSARAYSNKEKVQFSSFVKCPRFRKPSGRDGKNPSIKTAELLRQSIFEKREPSFLVDGFGKIVQERYDEYIRDLDNTRRAMMPWPKNFAAYRKKLIAALEKQLVDGMG
jgi:hypothetical protein